MSEKSEIQTQGVDFDLGTRPHGLPAELPRTHQESLCPLSLHPLEDPQAPQARAVDLGFGKPEVYRSAKVRSCGRCIKAAVARHTEGLHYLRLDSIELVHLFRSVERSRSKAKQAIGKGLAKVGDLRATDSLWQKLQEQMQRCHQRRPA